MKKLTYPDGETAIAARPVSLTRERAESFLPRLDIDDEWQRKHDAGELPDGLLGFCGMLNTIWPEPQPTQEEAAWILALIKHMSWRCMGGVVLGDSNQVHAMHLIEVSKQVLAAAEE